jgi:nucleoside-diphosphate-sugar epimerase
MSSSYLVTGGAGFIGSNLVSRLVTDGHSVRVLDNFSTGKRDNLSDMLSEIELIEGDIRDLDVVDRCTRDVDFVLHQAAIPSVPRSIENPIESNENNISGTLNTLIAARDNGVKRVVFASSSSVYGDAPVLPKQEDMYPALLSPYALNKLAGEYYCKIFASVYGLETLSLRYFNVFGPRQDPESEYAAVIPKFITAFLDMRTPVIFGDGEQTRDFTFVDNVVSANLRATEVEKTRGEIVNVATGYRVSLNHLVDLLKEITGIQLDADYQETRIGDVKHSLADITRARDLLEYEPAVSFEEGLRQTYKWFKSRISR